MPTAKEQMLGLPDYVVEQAKVVDPRAFNLAHSAGLVIDPEALAGLPGIVFDARQTQAMPAT